VTVTAKFDAVADCVDAATVEPRLTVTQTYRGDDADAVIGRVPKLDTVPVAKVVDETTGLVAQAAAVEARLNPRVSD
jgi:hypothetical protein